MRCFRFIPSSCPSFPYFPLAPLFLSLSKECINRTDLYSAAASKPGPGEYTVSGLTRHGAETEEGIDFAHGASRADMVAGDEAMRPGPGEDRSWLVYGGLF